MSQQYASQILSTPRFSANKSYMLFLQVSKNAEILQITTNEEDFLTVNLNNNNYNFVLKNDWHYIHPIVQVIGTTYATGLITDISENSFTVLIKGTGGKAIQNDFNLIVYLFKK